MMELTVPYDDSIEVWKELKKSKYQEIVLQICKFPVIQPRKMNIFREWLPPYTTENVQWAYEYIYREL